MTAVPVTGVRPYGHGVSTVTPDTLLLSSLPATGRVQRADHTENKVLALAVMWKNSTSKTAFGGAFSVPSTRGIACTGTSRTLTVT